MSQPQPLPRVWHPLMNMTIWVPDYEAWHPYGSPPKYSELGICYFVVTQENLHLILKGEWPEFQRVSIVVKEFMFPGKAYKRKVQKWARVRNHNRPWEADFEHTWCSEATFKTKCHSFINWFIQHHPRNLMVIQAGENEADFFNDFLKTTVLGDCLGTRLNRKWLDLQTIYSYLAAPGGTAGIATILSHVFPDMEIEKAGLHCGVVDALWEMKAFVRWGFPVHANGSRFVMTARHRAHLEHRVR